MTHPNGHSAAPPLTVQQASATLERLRAALLRAVVVRPATLDLLLAALLARGHVLLEDVPGTGKTLAAKALARCISADFKRVQCTPDLLPSDVTGSGLYDPRTQTFTFVPGPVFANVVLVDEINRASPRTQSALLECMAEGHVTTDGVTRALPAPFFLIATQNPVEMSGTFPLPEAQLDRFLVQLALGYPSHDDELSILAREIHEDPLAALVPVATPDDVLALQGAARAVHVAEALLGYIVQVGRATREHDALSLGLSPRAGVAVMRCAQALALLRGRTFATADDVKAAARATMPHRLLARDRQPATAHAALDEVLAGVPVPLG